MTIEISSDTALKDKQYKPHYPKLPTDLVFQRLAAFIRHPEVDYGAENFALFFSKLFFVDFLGQMQDPDSEFQRYFFVFLAAPDSGKSYLIDRCQYIITHSLKAATDPAFGRHRLSEYLSFAVETYEEHGLEAAGQRALPPAQRDHHLVNTALIDNSYEVFKNSSIGAIELSTVTAARSGDRIVGVNRATDFLEYIASQQGIFAGSRVILVCIEGENQLQIMPVFKEIVKRTKSPEEAARVYHAFGQWFPRHYSDEWVWEFWERERKNGAGMAAVISSRKDVTELMHTLELDRYSELLQYIAQSLNIKEQDTMIVKNKPGKSLKLKPRLIDALVDSYFRTEADQKLLAEYQRITAL